MSLFQPVCERPAHLLSKRDIIATHAKIWARWGTATFGYIVLSAMMHDFVGDSGSADGLDKCYLSSGCKKVTKSYGSTI